MCLAHLCVNPKCMSLLKKINSVTDAPVFWISNVAIFSLIIFSISFGESLVLKTEDLKILVLENFSWAFIIPIAWLIFYTLRLYFKHGHKKLGTPEDTPEFSTATWISMLFSAGLGIGLLYSGTYEPMYHYLHAPQLAGLNDTDRFMESLNITYFHWGIPAWVLYSLTGLMFSHTSYNLKRPFMFAEYLPSKYKNIKISLNVFAILSILVGVITTFSIGVQQLNAGLSEISSSIPIDKSIQVILIAGITVVATISVLSGLKKGIKILSEFNIVLAALFLLLIVFSYGHISQNIRITIQALGHHISGFLESLTYTASFEDKKWISNWTILFWAWWASWAPFVGLFIARISKGRTIKEYLLGTILVPSLICIMWFTIFALAGLDLYASEPELLSQTLKLAPYKSLFLVINKTYFPFLLSILALVCIFIFYITSSDSGSYVVDMIASGGKKAPNNYLKVYWSCVEGLLAAVLLYFGGTIFIKNLVILFSLPIIFYICFGVYKLDKMLKA